MLPRDSANRPYTPRFVRPTFPSPFVLTPRDIDIVRTVARHRFLNSVQISRLIEGSNKHLRERLKGLYWNRFLDRPLASELVLRPGGGSYPSIYALSSKGARLLIEVDGIDAARIGWTKKNNSARRPFIEHTLAISDLATSLFAATDARADVSFDDMDALTAALPAKRRDMAQPFVWRISTMHKGRHHTLGLAPDYAFSLKPDDMHRAHFYMVECDRGTMPVKRYGMVAHHIAHHLGRSAQLRFMHHFSAAQKHPMIAVQAFNADAGLVRGNHRGTAQIELCLQAQFGWPIHA